MKSDKKLKLVPTAENPLPDEAAGAESDDPLCIMGRVPPLLDVKEVTAFCRKVHRKKFGSYGWRFVLEMEIVEPEVHAGEVLEMFIRDNPQWNGRPPVSSKLYQAIMAATGGSVKSRQRISKSVFLNKVFRCRTATVKKGPASYTVIDQILEKIAGA